MNRHENLVSHCIRLCQDIFAAAGSFTARRATQPHKVDGELVRTFDGKTRVVRFAIGYRERVTPQTAGQILDRLTEDHRGPGDFTVLFAPTITPRVAAMASERGVSFIDGAGNCRIVDARSGLFIERRGRRDASLRRKQRISDAFSPKSSRVIRAMLHEPRKLWKVEELARHSDVGVSVGLVAKVKDWLIKEQYATVSGRRLLLTRPADLLNDWAKRYTGAARQNGYYLRGDATTIEETVGTWCASKGVGYALARLSAAWRLAPDIRYTVATLYLHAAGFEHNELTESLRKDCGATEVDTGANLLVLEPRDPSVFVRAEGTPIVVTSPLQTYLDLRFTQGRGADVAQTIYDRYVRESFEKCQSEGAA